MLYRSRVLSNLAKIIKATELQIAQSIRPNEHTHVFLDIDKTLLVPKQQLGSDDWVEYAKDQQGLDQTLRSYYKAQNITSVRLVHPSIPAKLQKLSRYGKVHIAGLTLRDPIIRDATLQQLNSLSISFAKLANGLEDKALHPQHNINYSQGIVFCGGNSKDIALLAYLRYYEKIYRRPDHIIFADDKLENVEKVVEQCRSLGIRATGIHYEEPSLSAAVDPDVVKVQEEHLLNIMSDNDAAVLVKHRQQQQNLLAYQQSVVRICVKALEYNYRTPWQAPQIRAWSGSGFIISGKYILTCAHVIDNPVNITVSLASGEPAYEAKLKAIGHDCDLAVLTVADQGFWQKVRTFDLSEEFIQGDEVTVVGYPEGKKELSLSRGIVTRGMIETYSHSEKKLPIIQVDAAINSGASGGAVFSGGKILGVAFQSIDGLQGLGHVIPAKVVANFLRQALKDNNYPGLIDPEIALRKINTAVEAKYYRIKKSLQGVIVKDVAESSFLHEKLKNNDVIVQVNKFNVDVNGCLTAYKGKKLHLIGYIQSMNVADELILLVKRSNKYIEIRTKISSNNYLLATAYNCAPNYIIMHTLVLQKIHTEHMDIFPGIKQPADITDSQVFISNVLKYKNSSELDWLEGNTIAKIDNKKITSLASAKKLLDVEKDYYKVELASGEKVIVAGVSLDSHNELLQQYGITVSSRLETTKTKNLRTKK